MKIKNEYVKIKTGEKNYDFSNLILDEYLNIIASSQCSGSSQEASFFPALTKCYIRLDRKLFFDETSELDANDFTFELTGDTDVRVTDMQKDKVIINYTYDETVLENYQNRQITAIGFFTEDNNNCCACLDVYNFGLKIGADIQIFRKDTLQVEDHIKIFDDMQPFPEYNVLKGLPCPIHLLPEPLHWKGETIYAYLWGIGIGTKNVVRVKTNFTNSSKICEDNKIIINDYILHNHNIRNIVEPSFKHPSLGLYPKNIQDAYNYVYLIYNVRNTNNYANKGYYCIVMPTNIVGRFFDYFIEYERSES